MFGEPHDLVHDFPEYKEQINELKEKDEHFAQLFREYHAVNAEVLRIEQNLETPSDQYTEDLKKKRVHLKDAVYEILRKEHA